MFLFFCSCPKQQGKETSSKKYFANINARKNNKTEKKETLKKSNTPKVFFFKNLSTICFYYSQIGVRIGEIFTDAGFDLSMFGEGYAKKAISRWNKIYLGEGAKGFRSEKRGKSSTGRPKQKYDPTNLDSVLKRLAYLEVENELLKKLRALEEESLKKKGSY